MPRPPAEFRNTFEAASPAGAACRLRHAAFGPRSRPKVLRSSAVAGVEGAKEEAGVE